MSQQKPKKYSDQGTVIFTNGIYIENESKESRFIEMPIDSNNNANVGVLYKKKDENEFNKDINVIFDFLGYDLLKVLKKSLLGIRNEKIIVLQNSSSSMNVSQIIDLIMVSFSDYCSSITPNWNDFGLNILGDSFIAHNNRRAILLSCERNKTPQLREKIDAESFLEINKEIANKISKTVFSKPQYTFFIKTYSFNDFIRYNDEIVNNIYYVFDLKKKEAEAEIYKNFTNERLNELSNNYNFRSELIQRLLNISLIE